MYFKLAFNNVRKSLKDYTIYFLTLTFGVCLFYVFNAVGDQKAMQFITGSPNKMLGMLSMMMNTASVFVAVILGFLIIYANKFLVKRRKQELGLYQCLGMQKGGVSKILVLETLYIGVFALAVGLLAGLVLSQGMSVLTAKMFDIRLKQMFTFTFSQLSLVKTILYFGIIFVVVMIFNYIAVSKYKLIDLFTASKKNETLHVKSLGLSVVLFLLSVVTLGFAYYFIIDNGMMVFDWEFWSAIGCGIVGTFLFFLSLSGFLLRMVKSSKRLYYRGLNMFVLRQINSKITTTYVSMTVICVLLLAAIGTLSTGLGATGAIKESMIAATPYNASIIYNNSSRMTAQEYLKAKDVYINDLVEEQVDIKFYRSPDVTYRQMFSEKFLSGLPMAKTQNKDYRDDPIRIIKLSQYNKALEMQGKDPITLGDGEYVMNCNISMSLDEIEKTVKDGREFIINGKTYKPKNGKVLGINLTTVASPDDEGSMVLPDAAVQGMEVMAGTLNLNFHSTDDTDQKEFLQRMEQGKELTGTKHRQVRVYTQQNMRDQSMGLSTVVCFLAIYIGLVFLLTCAAVLALQQLTESSDNLDRYQLLRKIGTEDRQIYSAIGGQIGIYFFMPLVLALVHSVVGISVAKNIVDIFGKVDSLGSILFTALILALIYGGYALATYFGSRAMVAAKKRRLTKE